ncbi:MAG: ATP-binding cassette domain-containing protein, partial [Chitinivibrionales bacterium]|nr:ATP-binding cassette domain-containing protein [Chitinivibrionales bacterium]
MNNGKIIKLEHVSKHYHRGSETVHALQDVSLDVTTGEYLAIAGHSGSGKTMLLNMIGCLDRPTRGTIAVDGCEIQQAPERELNRLRQSAIGFVFQQFFLIPTLTVIENTQLPALFAGKKAEQRALELLEMVGLGKRKHHLPGQLSGGEMQRVAIARSLINSPSILLADEPTGNLDSRNAATIIDLFETLNNDGMTVVLVTHNLDLVKRCNRTVHIEDGMVQA